MLASRLPSLRYSELTLRQRAGSVATADLPSLQPLQQEQRVFVDGDGFGAAFQLPIYCEM